MKRCPTCGKTFDNKAAFCPVDGAPLETTTQPVDPLIGVTLDGTLTYHRAVEVFGKVCSAIDRAHELGIIHRDLKPDNIMVEELPDGTLEVKVVDFGIAKFKGPAAGSAHL